VTDEGRRESAADELARAVEELRAARQLLDGRLPRIALTRIYFAVFHALRARLFADDFSPRTHAGVQHLFNLHFIRTGRYPAGWSRLVARLQKFREEADYALAFVIDAAGADEELAAASELVTRIESDIGGAAAT
jgi:uncharacterized protein (UPF0332 family)